MQRRIEALQQEGLVLEGQYRDIHDIYISQGGQVHHLEVRPLVAPHADITILRPVTSSIRMTPGAEYSPK